jgi:hypothetical protein
MEYLWYIRTGLDTMSDWENMSQPGMEQRSGVYIYKEWSGRTCLNQEWSGRTCLDQEWNGGALFIRVLYVLRKGTGYRM